MTQLISAKEERRRGGQGRKPEKEGREGREGGSWGRGESVIDKERTLFSSNKSCVN